MNLVIFPKEVVRALILIVLFLTLAGFAAGYIQVYWGSKGPLQILNVLRLTSDNSIPTWYSSFALLLCSILLAIIAAAKRRYGERWIAHWSVLSGIFLLLSIDEVARIHETVGNTVGGALASSAGFTSSALIYNPWVIPGIILIVIVLLTYLRFLAYLPRRTMLLLLFAGGLFVAGAIGTEMLGSILDSEVHESVERMRDAPYSAQITYEFLVAIEELLEMLSVVVVIYTLLSYISCYLKVATSLQIRLDNEQRPEEHMKPRAN